MLIEEHFSKDKFLKKMFDEDKNLETCRKGDFWKDTLARVLFSSNDINSVSSITCVDVMLHFKDFYDVKLSFFWMHLMNAIYEHITHSPDVKKS